MNRSSFPSLPLDPFGDLRSGLARFGIGGVGLVVVLCCLAPAALWDALSGWLGLFDAADSIAGPCVRLGSFSLLMVGVGAVWGTWKHWAMSMVGSFGAAVYMALRMAMDLEPGHFGLDYTFFMLFSVAVFVAVGRLMFSDEECYFTRAT